MSFDNDDEELNFVILILQSFFFLISFLHISSDDLSWRRLLCGLDFLFAVLKKKKNIVVVINYFLIKYMTLLLTKIQHKHG